ncbi:MAG: hypothetical protein OEW75_05455 [Cyclobacteriaceae bacterium]|nr:hypothetical protein [Cyclobacteriaceae bacterium]
MGAYILTSNMRYLILILTLTTIITGCQYDPYADKYTIVEPTDTDVIGTYEYDFQTIDISIDKNKFKSNGSRIIINSDRTYKIEMMPYFKEVAIMTYEFKRQISFSGSWRIQEIGTIDFGNGNLKKRWGILLYLAPKELQYAGFLGTEKPNGIIFGFGDPDSGNVMTFSKK